MTDVLESVRAISDANGNVTSRRDFMPFGEELLPDGTYRTTAQNYGSTNDKIRQKFTGYQKDEETQLDFAEARMYQNKHGRFTAVDPLLASGKSANPQTFNRYAYAMNRPLVLRDPSGLQAGAPDDEVIRIDTYWDSAKNTFGTFEEYLKSIGRSIRDFALNSDALANANNQRFQNRIDATRGDGEAADRLFERVGGSFGPTTDSVLQETTNAYRRAETVANIGFGLSNLTLGLAGMVSPGSATITTSNGFRVGSFNSSAISTEEGLNTVSNIRSTFNVSSGRNIAFASYNIDGSAGEAMAVSGQSIRIGMVGNPQNRLFTTQNVGGFSRAFDSEVKLFEFFGQRATPNSTGTVRLFTERPMCASCCSVCEQFRTTFPRIRVFTSSGP